MVYYNENDPYCCEWLEELIADRLLPLGVVDSRPIQKVKADEIRRYTQIHLFAGVGGWAYALRLAGWPEDRPILTGSCPCQPFSVAGQGKGFRDKRHLWPHMHRIVSGVRPACIMGEQVTGAAGYEWFDRVQADLEKEDYEGRAVDIPACGVNTPHIRQRLYWVAHPRRSSDERWLRPTQTSEATGYTEKEIQQLKRGRSDVRSGSRLGGVAHGVRKGLEKWQGKPEDTEEECEAVERSSDTDGVGQPKRDPENSGRATGKSTESADAAGRWTSIEFGRPSNPSGLEVGGAANPKNAQRWGSGIQKNDGRRNEETGGSGVPGRMEHSHESNSDGRPPSRKQSLHNQCNKSGFWHDYEIIPCLDNKSRRIEPGTFPLAHGVPARMGKLRAYGNAIVPELAAEVIRAYMEAYPDY